MPFQNFLLHVKNVSSYSYFCTPSRLCGCSNAVVVVLSFTEFTRVRNVSACMSFCPFASVI